MSLSILKTSFSPTPCCYYGSVVQQSANGMEKQLSVDSVSAPNKEAYLQGITRKFFPLPLPLPTTKEE